MLYRFIFICFLTLTLSLNAKELLKTTTDWSGNPLHYPKGQAEITSILLTLKKNEWSPMHCHPVPTLGYIKSGTVEIHSSLGKKLILSEGQSAVEVFKTPHKGKALTKKAEIVVFYASAVGVKNTLIGHDMEKHCLVK